MYSKQEAKQVRERFWSEFNSNSAQLRAIHGKQRKWMLYKTGLKSVELKFELNNQHMAVMIEISHRNVYKRLEVYEKFEQVKVLLNDAYDGDLIWDDEVVTPFGKEACRIYDKKEGVNINRTEQWPEIMDWLMNKMLSLENALEDVIDFLKPEVEQVFAED